MRRVIALLLLLVGGFVVRAQEARTNPPTTLMIVLGAAGEEEYGNVFQVWTEHWRKAGQLAGAKTVVIGPAHGTNVSGARTNEVVPGTNDLQRIEDFLDQEPKNVGADLWIVLIGHGTYDGKQAKFNLIGPDLTSTNLATRLQPFKRPVAVVDCSSASGPFLKAIAGAGRVVITSTKSGSEQNYSRFGRFMAEALGDPQADLDKDGQTSLLELYLYASSRVAEFYKTEGRLATEHPLLDDNGDGLGTPPDWFRGVRAVKRAADGAPPDGLRAHQMHLVQSEQERKLSPGMRAWRDQLERDIAALREEKAKMAEQNYYARLEEYLIEIARVYERAETGQVSQVRPISQGPHGVILLGAANAAIHGTVLRYEPREEKHTLGYWTRVEDWVSWDVKIEKPGTYQVEMMQAAGKGSGGSAYTVTVGNQEIQDVVPETGAFTTFVARTIGKVKLDAAGLVTVSIKPTAKPGIAVMDLQQVVLRPVP